jgi:hypothetical protein
MTVGPLFSARVITAIVTVQQRQQYDRVQCYNGNVNIESISAI